MNGVSHPNRVLRLVLSLGGIAGIVLACASVPRVHPATVVLLLLLLILVVASRWGFLEAALATVLGAMLLDYFFLPPLGWAIGSPEHWLDLLTFVIVGLVASHLAARAKRLTEEAIARRLEVEKLYAFGRDLPIGEGPGSVIAASLHSLVHIFQARAAVYYSLDSGEVSSTGAEGFAFSTPLLRRAAAESIAFSDPEAGSLFAPIRCAGKPLGSLAVYGGMSAFTLRAIANRIEVGLEKWFAHEESRQAEETRKSQELKTALLDSLVHEIKTPLSVIKTAVTSLLSRDSDAASRRELLTIANQEVDRMDASISEVFWAARVEASALKSGKGPQNMGPLVDGILQELRPLLGDRSVFVDVAKPLPPANCDFDMIKGVMKELVRNALKYSPSHSPVKISVKQVGEELITSVSDSGVGIPLDEQERIFERHYRGSSAPATGTGLGLAIAKTIVEAHGGQLGVESQPGAGSVFRFSLPVSHRDAA